MINHSPISSDLEFDPIFKEAAELVIRSQKVSSSFIQRRLKLGYARSARIIDLLESAGIIGPANGINPRLVLIEKLEDLDNTKLPIVKTINQPTPTLKWNKTIEPMKQLILNLGKDGKGNEVSIDLEKYNNLIAVGSQMTNISDLINNIILEQVQSKSPDDLKLVVIDGFINQMELPNGSPHLLTPIITDSVKVETAFAWLQTEVTRRLKIDNDFLKNQPKILLVINGFNEIIFYSSPQTEDRLALIFGYAKRVGIYIVISADYIDGRINKWIQSNNGAKIVFRPTSKQMARSSGVSESFNLESPDQAILETMYEGKTKLTVEKIDYKKIYEEIFE